MLVGELFDIDNLVALGSAAEELASRDTTEKDPGLAGNNGEVWPRRRAADLDFAPSRVAGQRHQIASLGKNLDPAIAVAVIIADHFETNDFRAAQPSLEAQGQDCPVARPAQIIADCAETHLDVVACVRLVSRRRPGVSLNSAIQRR